MVYITSDLFGPDTRLDRASSPTSAQFQSRHSMVDSQTGLGKRKRRMNDSDEGSASEYGWHAGYPCNMDGSSASDSNYISHQRSPPASKGLLKLHGHGPAFEANNRMYPLSVAASTYFTSERRPVKHLKRLNPKIALVKTPSHLMDVEPGPTSSPSNTNSNKNTVSDLRPCHACKTAPKRRRDLENYMECRRCDGRTCYICARECLGCQKAICKKCIVEVGEEGDPWCLECYSRHINS